MRTNDDIESYLIDLDLHYEELGEGLWRVQNGAANIVIAHTPPVVVFRVKMFEVPKQRREELFHRLLELNAKEMVHGAYGIEDNNVVLIDSLQSENLDLNELQASIDSLTLAVHNHHDLLSQYQSPVAARQ
jgi:hypothetical protein